MYIRQVFLTFINKMLHLIIVFLVVYFFYHHFTKYNNYWIERNIPGPKPVFFFGNIKDLALRNKSFGHICQEIYDKYPNEKIVGIFRMRTPNLLIKDPEIIKHVLIKDFDCFVEREPQFSHKALGTNLLHVNGDIWRRLRSRLTVFFTPRRLKNMIYLTTKCSERLVNYIDDTITKQPEQEVHGLLKKFTQENIVACAFGIDLDSCDALSDTLNGLERKLFVIDHRAELEMMYPGILKKLHISLMPKQVSTFFSNLAKSIIKQRNGELEGNDFVDLLLALRKTAANFEKPLDITDDLIASQMFIFYIAGYQTTATTMSFMLYHLALDSEIQDKIVAEIQGVLQKHKGKLTYEAISELKYTEQVMYETLRMHPPGDNLRRLAMTNYTIPGTDLIVRKGQLCIIPVKVVHMDPNNYPEPEKFDPERFTPKNVKERHSCAFLPFGKGPRNCIGMRFAILAIKICMAMLLSKFRVKLSQHTPKKLKFESSRLIVYPVGGFPLKLVHRKVK